MNNDTFVESPCVLLLSIWFRVWNPGFVKYLKMRSSEVHNIMDFIWTQVHCTTCKGILPSCKHIDQNSENVWLEAGDDILILLVYPCLLYSKMIGLPFHMMWCHSLQYCWCLPEGRRREKKESGGFKWTWEEIVVSQWECPLCKSRLTTLIFSQEFSISIIQPLK